MDVKGAVLRNLVLVGGGHAHLSTIRDIPLFVERDVAVTVIAPSPFQYYSGMGPGMLGGDYRPEDIRFATRETVERAGGRFVEDLVVGIDAASSPDPPAIGARACLRPPLLQLRQSGLDGGIGGCRRYGIHRQADRAAPLPAGPDSQAGKIAQPAYRHHRRRSVGGRGGRQYPLACRKPASFGGAGLAVLPGAVHGPIHQAGAVPLSRDAGSGGGWSFSRAGRWRRCALTVC